jgi:uncharacterized protein (TIGR03435 family)
MAASVGAMFAVALLAGVASGPLRAQSAAGQAPAGDPLKAAGDKLAFDVASVKPNTSGGESNSNFPLGPGDVYAPNGGYFSATGFSLGSYIAFAYKVTPYQMQSLLSQLPGWASTDRYDIQARVKGNPSKDQMRLMMRSLLADRFKLGVHTETQQVPVYAVLLAKPGTTGPQLQPHLDGAPCSTTLPSASDPAPQSNVAGKFPALCGGIFNMPPSAPGRERAGARNVPMGMIASALTAMGNLGRPVLDQTGIGGTFDFSFEWTPDPDAVPPGVDFQPDPSGPSFQGALKEQLGLKLESQKGPTDVIVVDHVERPSAN